MDSETRWHSPHPGNDTLQTSKQMDAEKNLNVTRSHNFRAPPWCSLGWQTALRVSLMWPVGQNAERGRKTTVRLTARDEEGDLAEGANCRWQEMGRNNRKSWDSLLFCLSKTHFHLLMPCKRTEIKQTITSCLIYWKWENYSSQKGGSFVRLPFRGSVTKHVAEQLLLQNNGDFP